MTFTRHMTAAATSLILAGFVFSIGVANAATRAEVMRMVVEEARDSQVPTALALAVAKVESDFDERALSSAGARGVMQITPATAKDVFGITRDELWDARLNLQLGIDYLEQLHEQYGGRWDLALSHYNGGSLKGGRGANARPHDYTRKYVADVMKWHAHFVEQARIWQVAGDPTDMDNLNDAISSTNRAVDIISNDWRSNEERDHRSRVTRVVVRRLSDSGGAMVGGPEVLEFMNSTNLTERLSWARENLDDFASGTVFVRWYGG